MYIGNLQEQVGFRFLLLNYVITSDLLYTNVVPTEERLIYLKPMKEKKDFERVSVFT